MHFQIWDSTDKKMPKLLFLFSLTFSLSFQHRSLSLRLVLSSLSSPLYSSFTTSPISPHWPPCHAAELAVPSTTPLSLPCHPPRHIRPPSLPCHPPCHAADLSSCETFLFWWWFFFFLVTVGFIVVGIGWFSWVVVVAFFVVAGRLWGSGLSRGIGGSNSGGFLSCFVIGFVVVAVLGYGWLWWCDLMVDSVVGGFRWVSFFFFGCLCGFWCGGFGVFDGGLWGWWTVLTCEVGYGAVGVVGF